MGHVAQMILKGQLVVEFECPAPDSLNGHLLLNEEQRRSLHALLDEDEDQQPWYLDADGERWEAEELFARSPWALVTSSGHLNVLNRWLNYETGEAGFDLPGQYGGELFRFLRKS